MIGFGLNMNKINIGLSLIVPVYNEIEGIKTSLEFFLSIFSKSKIPFELIFINDGSNDGTRDIIEKFIKKNKNKINLKLINHNINRGYGAAIKTGIVNSKYSIIGITDADNTYPNDKMLKFYNEMILKKYDMMVGARVGDNVKIPIVRKPAKYIINQMANYLSGVKIPDLNSGMRLMKKEVLFKYINFLPDGFSLTTTITLAMLTNGNYVHYKKIDYYHRTGNSKIRPIRDTINFIQLIIRTILLFNPLKIFIPFSLILFLGGIFLLIYRLIFDDIFGVTATVLIVGSVQVLAIGMLADLIDRRLSK